MTQDDLRQLTQDTRDSIRGTNNYVPGRGEIREYPRANPFDLPENRTYWQDNELEHD